MAAATTLFGQDWSSSKNTLLSFSVKSSAAILERLDSYELTTEREKDLYVRYQDTLNVRLARVVLPVVYSQLAAAEITLEPKDALVDLVTYGQDGLPSILIPKQVIKRLANKGYTSDHYFVIKINMEAQGMMGGVTARVKPRARCQIKVFAAARKVVKEVDSERVATDFIRSTDFPRRRFDKIGLDYIEMLQARMEPLVLRAVEEAVGQL
jgi:hypothetical protein